MKDFFISSTDNKVKICNETGSDCSLPVLIRLNQYQFNTTGNKFRSYEADNSGIGYMGSQCYDFGITVNFPEENTNRRWLNNMISFNEKNSTIMRENIFSKFFVLEIDDYSAQAMSPFCTDFVPHVYIAGHKLWQKYIAIIKHYSKKKAYILIDKDENNLKNEGLLLNEPKL